MSLKDTDIESILSVAFDDNTLDEAIKILTYTKSIGNAALIADLRQIILDPSQTWTEKADHWIGMNVHPEEENEKFWRTIWDTISEGQPWPLDEAKPKS